MYATNSDSASLLHQPGIQRTLLSNGITVITVENPAADIISGRIFIRAGSRWEPKSKAGLVHLLAAVLTKGTELRSSLEIADRVESMGASLGTDATTDYFLLSLKTVSADFSEIFQLAAELLRSPSFPETEVELERRLALQDIRSQQEQPFTVVFDQLRRTMYGDHPYACSSLGTEATVSQLTRDDLQEFHRTYFRPDNLVISLAGRLRHSDAIALVEKMFGDWQIPDVPLPQLQLPQVTTSPQRAIKPQDTQQAIVMVGYLSPSVHEDGYAALKLLNTYLGNGLSSRLFVELREKRGLAYDVSAFYPTRLETSQFVSYIGTAPQNTQTALEGLHQEMTRLCDVLLTPEELQACKNKLLGQYALGKQTNAQLAQIYGWYEVLGLGLEFDTQFQVEIANVTAESAQQAAQHCFSGDPYLSLIGPEAFVNF